VAKKNDPPVLTLADLKGAEYNPRTISERARKGLDASMTGFGDLSGITHNVRSGNLVCGHQRVSVLREHGAQVEHDEVGPFIRDPTTGEVFRIRLVDWDMGTERAANVAANNPAIAGTFSDEILDVLDAIKTDDPQRYEALNFADLVDMLPKSITGKTRGRATGADDVPPTPAKPTSRTGDLWVLGGHRIICGESRDPAAMSRLMDGKKAALYATDPPYGVGYDGTSHPLNAKDKEAGKAVGSNNRDWGDEYWDHYDSNQAYQQMLTDIFVLARKYLADNAPWYCWHAESMVRENRAAWEAAGVRYHQTIIWVKPCAILGYSVWNFREEPCMMGWVQGHRPKLHKIDEMTNVWLVDWVGQGRCQEIGVKDKEAADGVKWIKPCALLGYCIWPSKLRPCDDGTEKAARPDVEPDGMSNVWFCDWEGKGRCTDRQHPTQKPIRLFELPMLKHTKRGDICLESFSGSGSQVMAGETTGRRVFAIERMPGFTDVCIMRWQNFTGKQAILEGDGRTFDQVMAARLAEETT
jgi:DNA modification methylase